MLGLIAFTRDEWQREGAKFSKGPTCLLNQLGLNSQKPLWRAYQQDPEKLDEWLNARFPRIRRN